MHRVIGATGATTSLVDTVSTVNIEGLLWRDPPSPQVTCAAPLRSRSPAFMCVCTHHALCAGSPGVWRTASWERTKQEEAEWNAFHNSVFSLCFSSILAMISSSRSRYAVSTLRNVAVHRPLTARTTAAARPLTANAARTMSTSPRSASPSSLGQVQNIAATSSFPSPPPLRLTPPSPAEEEADFKRACEEVQRFFDSPRFKGIKRPYGPAAVVSKRGSVPVTPPQSSLMADKLFSIFRHRFSKGEPVHTMGAIDPVQQSQMAYHQEVTYVSGWAASSVLTTCANEVGPDLADYPYTTVPNQVQVRRPRRRRRGIAATSLRLLTNHALLCSLYSVFSRHSSTMTANIGMSAVSSRRNSAKTPPGSITCDPSSPTPTRVTAV